MDFLREWEQKLGIKITCSQVRCEALFWSSQDPGASV